MKMKKLLAGLLSAAMVVTSVSFGGFGVNEVNATATVDENNFIEFWTSQHAANTLGTIEDTDRWLFQSKDNGQWANIVIENNVNGKWGYGHNDNGDQGACTGDKRGEFRRHHNWDNKICSNGFAKVNDAHQSIAVSWKAPAAGYYRFEQVGTATDRYNGRVEVWHVPATALATDGEWLGDSEQKTDHSINLKIRKMEAGDLFRVNTKRNDISINTMNYAGPRNDSSTLSWKVVPCTARDYAVQWLPTVNADTTKPEALQNAVNESKEALQAMVEGSTATDEEIKQKIDDLEAKIARMNNYVAVTGVTVDSDEILNLTVGQTVTLTAKGNQDAYADVTYTLEGATEVLTQNSNVFTAATPGTATIKVASVYEPEVFKTVTVNVAANKAALTQKIEDAKTYLTEKYTDASKDTLRKAITKAEEVVNNHTAAENLVTDAIKALDEAINGLVARCTVNVTSGTLTDGTTSTIVDYTEKVTVTADKAPEGKKFSHWTNDGVIVCYNPTYTFPVIKDTTIVANYVAVAETVKPTAQIACTVAFDSVANKATFTAQRTLPAGATNVKHGIIITDDAGKNHYGENFTLNAKRKVQSEAKTTGLLGTYSVSLSGWTGSWHAKAYVQYTLNGETFVKYSTGYASCTFK